MIEFDPDRLDWEKVSGLVPAIIQDSTTSQVLMLGFMNRESLQKTLVSGKVTFWSRTRKKLWTKGETSGNFLQLVNILVDCDNDTLLVKAAPVGPVCHTGTLTCFEDECIGSGSSFLEYLQDLILDRKEKLPDGSYTTELFRGGETQVCKKLGEEAIEVILSVAQGRERTVEECADLLYHLLVLLVSRGIRLEEVAKELSARHKRSAVHAE